MAANRSPSQHAALLTRQNLREWAIVSLTQGAKKCSLQEFSQDLLLPHAFPSMNIIVFANEREINRFLAEQNPKYSAVQKYIRIMRSFPSQGSVLTLEEYAAEVDSVLPGVDRVPLHSDLLRSIRREQGRHVANRNKRFYLTNDDVSASGVVSLSCVDPASQTQASLFRALRWLSSRSLVRMCRTTESMMALDPSNLPCRIVRGTWGGGAELEGVSGTDMHYAVILGGEVQYRMSLPTTNPYNEHLAPEIVDLPVVMFPEATFEFTEYAPGRKKRGVDRTMPFDLIGAAN